MEVSASTRVTDELKDATDRARRASRQQQNRLAERGDTKEHAKWMQHRLKLTPKQLKEEEQLEAYRKSGGNKRRGTAAAAAAPSAANLNRRPRRVGGVSGGTAGLRLLDYEGGMAPAPAPADEEEEADKEEEEDDADFAALTAEYGNEAYAAVILLGHRLGLEDDDAVLEVIHDRINALSMKTDAEVRVSGLRAKADAMVARLHKVRSSGSYVPPDEEGEEAKEAAAAAPSSARMSAARAAQARLAAAQQAEEEEADKTKPKPTKEASFVPVVASSSDEPNSLATMEREYDFRLRAAEQRSDRLAKRVDQSSNILHEALAGLRHLAHLAAPTTAPGPASAAPKAAAAAAPVPAESGPESPDRAERLHADAVKELRSVRETLDALYALVTDPTKMAAHLSAMKKSQPAPSPRPSLSRGMSVASSGASSPRRGVQRAGAERSLQPFADGDPRANKELDGNLEGEDAFAMSRSEIKNQGAKIVKQAMVLKEKQAAAAQGGRSP